MIEKAHFRIIINGVTSGNSPQQVIANLGRFFKTDSSRSQALEKNHRILIKKHVNREKAEAYRTALKNGEKGDRSILQRKKDSNKSVPFSLI